MTALNFLECFVFNILDFAAVKYGAEATHWMWPSKLP
jgi:hypothetical protein